MDKQSIYTKTINHFLAPIKPYLDDPGVSEVMVNGIDSIYFEKEGQVQKSEVSFESDRALMAAIRNIAEFVGRPLHRKCQSLDARLPTGERVHAIWPPSSRTGICLTIRKFLKATYALRDLTRKGMLSANAAKFLSAAVKLHKNIIVAGGTGTGKTTMLNALSAEIPESERIVIIEDSSELRLQQEHAVYLETQNGDEYGEGAITIRDLFVESLRMRPDRIVVGEVRRGEALDLIQSMTSGHSGTLSTLHASTPHDALARLETLCLMSDTGIPIYVARSQVGSAVDLVVQIVRESGHRKVARISECLGLDQNNNYVLQDLFSSKNLIGKNGDIQSFLGREKVAPSFLDEAVESGHTELAEMFAAKSA